MDRFLVEKTHAHLNYDADLLQRLTKIYYAQTRTHKLIPIRTYERTDTNSFIPIRWRVNYPVSRIRRELTEVRLKHPTETRTVLTFEVCRHFAQALRRFSTTSERHRCSRQLPRANVACVPRRDKKRVEGRATHAILHRNRAFAPPGLPRLPHRAGARPGRRNLPHGRDHLDHGLRRHLAFHRGDACLHVCPHSVRFDVRLRSARQPLWRRPPRVL
eukprot:scaffold21620_cov65-Phaeocystis_antarctica.AAC.5